MRSSSWLAALAGLFAGCTQILSLESSVDDADFDGIPDRADNCATEPNPQQRDLDRDGIGDACQCGAGPVVEDRDGDGIDDVCDDCVGTAIGADSGSDGIDDGCETCAAAVGSDVDLDGVDDACDPCNLGPPHDEDGDEVPDACDNCPSQPNRDQVLSTTPSIGASCNVFGPGPWKLAFDPLVEQDFAMFPGSAPNWRWAQDGLETTVGGALGTTILSRLPVTVEARISTSILASMSLIGAGGLNHSCSVNDQRTVRISSGLGSLLISGNELGGPVPGVGPIRLRMTIPVNGTVKCEALDPVGDTLLELSATYLPGLDAGRVSLSATGAARYEYVWAVATWD